MTENVWANCRECCRFTMHTVLAEHVVPSDEISNYHDRNSWQIVRCNGCCTVGFCHIYDDYEDVQEDIFGQIQHRVHTATYPRALANHKKLNEYELPQVICRVYSQTLSAYGENALVLSGIGLRATIEAVCNELKVTGRTLEKRIDKLFDEGYVTNADKKLLHAIRFLGNDAAHEIVEPTESEMRVALGIVEHLLNSVFILQGRAESLNVVLETMDDLKKFVDERLTTQRKARVLSLKQLLGSRYRLSGSTLKSPDSLEQCFKAEISKNTFPRLSIANEGVVNGRKVQLYSLQEIAD